MTSIFLKNYERKFVHAIHLIVPGMKYEEAFTRKAFLKCFNKLEENL